MYTVAASVCVYLITVCIPLTCTESGSMWSELGLCPSFEQPLSDSSLYLPSLYHNHALVTYN